MKITVNKIETDDFRNSPMMNVSVGIYDEGGGEFHNSATVNVFIIKRDASLSELKADAIRTAIDFLKFAIASHS